MKPVTFFLSIFYSPQCSMRLLCTFFYIFDVPLWILPFQVFYYTSYFQITPVTKKKYNCLSFSEYLLSCSICFFSSVSVVPGPKKRATRFRFPESSKLILLNNQQMQLYAVNFIPLLSSLYMFRAAHTPIIRSTMFNCIYSHWYKP